jgi:hypothetical protein
MVRVMPSFTTDGPDIPIEVIQALEDGELALFAAPVCQSRLACRCSAS